MKKHNKKTWRETGFIIGAWLFSMYYTIGYLLDRPFFPVTHWLKALYKPIYSALFGGPS
ncbi:hypothetical protein SAMN05216353_1679 [Halobacillus alkaliphilus]|uniref:Uncharacterized protein n=1 Tax=Halobacillus alkaliphilus TaxID=396056 RepID=A0A1I2TE34_9BACI|nr:hypothetical protein [Halobacillus alkaliphilus]SFG63080.1 hypothetical protein SAMN05216353_1679 [Halobacillus alkaliphilus]